MLDALINAILGLLGAIAYFIGVVVFSFLVLVLFVELTYTPHNPPTKEEWRHM